MSSSSMAKSQQAIDNYVNRQGTSINRQDKYRSTGRESIDKTSIDQQDKYQSTRQVTSIDQQVFFTGCFSMSLSFVSALTLLSVVDAMDVGLDTRS